MPSDAFVTLRSHAADQIIDQIMDGRCSRNSVTIAYAYMHGKSTVFSNNATAQMRI